MRSTLFPLAAAGELDTGALVIIGVAIAISLAPFLAFYLFRKRKAKLAFDDCAPDDPKRVQPQCETHNVLLLAIFVVIFLAMLAGAVFLGHEEPLIWILAGVFGLVVVVIAFSTRYTLFSGKSSLTVDHAMVPGREVTLTWRVPFLRGCREAVVLLSGSLRYMKQQGQHSTVHSVAFRHLVLHREEAPEPDGSVTVSLPPDLPHSLPLGTHLGLFWRLRIIGVKKGLLSPSVSYKANILPAGTEWEKKND